MKKLNKTKCKFCKEAGIWLTPDHRQGERGEEFLNVCNQCGEKLFARLCASQPFIKRFERVS